MSLGQGHNRDLNGLQSLADAAKAVVEGKTKVYELVGNLSDEQVQEVLEASLEAKEEGKVEFEYEGTVYSVDIGEQLSTHLAEKELDPVGKEDDDIDNDGDVDSSDEYLKKKRDAIGKAMKKEDEEEEEEDEQLDEYGAAGNLRADKDSLDGKKDVPMSPENNPLDDEDIEKKDGEEEESEDPKETKSEGFTEEEVRALCHSKDHDCATIIEHPEFGLGKPVHGSHAIPDDNGFVEWYDVEFKHGIEKKVQVEGVKVIASESHMKEEEDDAVDGAKPIDKDVDKSVTTSKVSEPKGGDSKVDTDEEDDGIEGTAKISKEGKSFVELYQDMIKESVKEKEINKKIAEAIELKEGKMKELHGHIEDGKTAEEIIKAMKLKKTPDMIKFIKGLGSK